MITFRNRVRLDLRGRTQTDRDRDRSFRNQRVGHRAQRRLQGRKANRLCPRRTRLRIEGRRRSRASERSSHPGDRGSELQRSGHRISREILVRNFQGLNATALFALLCFGQLAQNKRFKNPLLNFRFFITHVIAMI